MKSNKQKNKWRTPFRINSLGILFGTISIAIGFVCNNITILCVPSFIINIFYGAGASFVTGAILNIISEHRIGNLLSQTVMNGIYETAVDARHIRYNQIIKFTISEFPNNEGEKYLKLDCIHSYILHNESKSDNKISVDVFNDLNILSRELNGRLPSQYKTQFEEITITHSKTGEVENFSPNNREHKDKFFEPDEYGRPRFVVKNIKVDARNGGNSGWVKISYKISNAHYLKSSQSWYFQELSDGLELIIDNRTDYPNRCFSLIINHPNREEIESYNTDSISTAGRLQGNGQNISVKTNFVFLPYQGFSIQWDLTEYAESQKQQENEAELTNNAN
jgi:hypothetical protein